MKKLNRILFSGAALTALFVLSGCVQQKNGKPTGDGLVYNLLVKPMGNVIHFFANNLGFGFGIAIIIVTLIVRLIILPLGLYQAWKSSYQSEKMNYLKPILKPIQDRMKNAKTQEEKMAAQQELMKTQRENGLSMFGGIGCLPLLIQMPFFSALFYASKFTTGISSSTFWGIPLGEKSLVLTAIAGIFYLFQSLISTIGMPEEQKRQMRSMIIISPVMIIFFSLNSPAGVTLYWVVSGFVGIIQTIITTFIIKPILRKRIDKEFAENPPKLASEAIKDVTPASTASTQKTVLDNPNKKKRNAGRQRR